MIWSSWSVLSARNQNESLSFLPKLLDNYFNADNWRVYFKAEYIIWNKTTIHVLWWIKTIWSFATLQRTDHVDQIIWIHKNPKLKNAIIVNGAYHLIKIWIRRIIHDGRFRMISKVLQNRSSWIKTIWSFATLQKCNKSKHMIIMKCSWFREPVKNTTWKAEIITWVKFVLANRLFQLRNVSWTVRASSYRILK